MFKVGIQRHILTPVFLGFYAVIVALLITCIRGIENMGVPDAESYTYSARGITNGFSYMFAHPGEFGHGLGFSTLIALTFFITHSHSLLLFKIILAIGHGLSAYLVARIGIMMGLRKWLWFIAGLTFLLDPFILFAATDIQTESLTTLFVLYWAYLYLSPVSSVLTKKLQVVWLPLTGFYSVFMRPNSILPFVLVALLIYVKWYRERMSARLMSISVAIFMFLLTIYEIFLTRLNSGFVFLSPIGGASAVGMCDGSLIPQYLGFVSKSENFRLNHLGDNVSESIGKIQGNISISELNSKLYDTGISNCLNDPLQSALTLAMKTFALWRPYTVLGAYGIQMFLVTLAIWLPLTIFAVWYLKNKKLSAVNIRLRNYYIVMALGFTMSLLLTSTQIRHRVAIAEPFYWLFFAYFVGEKISDKKLSKVNPNIASIDKR